MSQASLNHIKIVIRRFFEEFAFGSWDRFKDQNTWVCMVYLGVWLVQLTLQPTLLSDTQRSLSCDLGNQWAVPRLGGSNRWNGLNHTAVMQLSKIRIKIINRYCTIDRYVIDHSPVLGDMKPPFWMGVSRWQSSFRMVFWPETSSMVSHSCGQGWQWNYFDTAIALESWHTKLSGGAATRKCVLYKEGRETNLWIPKLL